MNYKWGTQRVVRHPFLVHNYAHEKLKSHKWFKKIYAEILNTLDTLLLSYRSQIWLVLIICEWVRIKLHFKMWIVELESEWKLIPPPF